MLSYEQAHFLWQLSFLCIISFSYAIYRKYYDLALVPFFVWISSMIYWSDHLTTWKRHLDMVVVGLAMVWQVFRAWFAERWFLYYMILVFAMTCYILSAELETVDTWLSTFAHGFLHVFANLSNVILYSGYVPSLF